MEDALGLRVPDEVDRLRALLVELERLYNHAAYPGALANDVGFGLANAHAQRVREQLLRINEATTGHRLLRGGVRPGAVALRALPDTPRLRSLAADGAEIPELTLGNNGGPTCHAIDAAPGGGRRSGVGIVEGCRGTIVHRVEVDAARRITRAKVVDPSWFNWPALPVAMNDTIVSDFPLAKKSFNQSYAGNDL